MQTNHDYYFDLDDESLHIYRHYDSVTLTSGGSKELHVKFRLCHLPGLRELVLELEEQAGVSTTAHTPGPWRNDFRPSTGFGCGYGKSQIIAGNDVPIAGVAAVEPEHGPMHRNDVLSVETFETLEANARLMAAAPDLLAACKAARGPARMDNNAFEKLSAAIAKATSEEVPA